MARVLIAGCGYVGSALGVRLASRGHLVWGLRRDCASLPASVQAVEADLVVPNTLRNLPRIDLVYYLASPGGPGEDSLRAIRVDGLRYLLGALAHQQQRIARFFLASDLAVYGLRAGRWVDEDSEVAPLRGAAAAALAGERLLAEARTPGTALRFGTIYGPGRLGPLSDVLDGRAQVADPRAFENLVHRDDCAGALAHLLARPDEAARLYLLVDREPTPHLSLLQWLAAQLDRPVPLVVEGARRGTDARCMSERLVESGYHFRYPSFREGFASLLTRVR